MNYSGTGLFKLTISRKMISSNFLINLTKEELKILDINLLDCLSKSPLVSNKIRRLNNLNTMNKYLSQKLK
jgi:hypothetical protein